MSLTRRLAAYSGARRRRLQPLMDTDEVATLQAHPCEVVEPNCFLAVEMRAKDVSHMTVACQGREKADCRDTAAAITSRSALTAGLTMFACPTSSRASSAPLAAGSTVSAARCNVSFAPKPTDWCAATNCRQVPIGDMVRSARRRTISLMNVMRDLAQSLNN